MNDFIVEQIVNTMKDIEAEIGFYEAEAYLQSEMKLLLMQTRRQLLERSAFEEIRSRLETELYFN